jgi:hypothetical protein
MLPIIIAAIIATEKERASKRLAPEAKMTLTTQRLMTFAS